MLIKALEVSGIEGTFRLTCENVMRVLRANKDSLIAILAAFLHNPLISFKLQLPQLIKAQKNKDAALIPDEESTTESLKKDKFEELVITEAHHRLRSDSKKLINPTAKQDNKENDNIELGNKDKEDNDNRRRKMESNERQLFNKFEERDEIEFEELNKIAKMVL